MKYLIAGLGNIGPEYELTRHNAGFLVLDRLADNHKIEFILTTLKKSASSEVNKSDTQILDTLIEELIIETTKEKKLLNKRNQEN